MKSVTLGQHLPLLLELQVASGDQSCVVKNWTSQPSSRPQSGDELLEPPDTGLLTSGLLGRSQLALGPGGLLLVQMSGMLGGCPHAPAPESPPLWRGLFYVYVCLPLDSRLLEANGPLVEHVLTVPGAGTTAC